MELNFLCMICTIRSISFGVMGRVRDCSRNRFITCVVNSLQAYWKECFALDVHLSPISVIVPVRIFPALDDRWFEFGQA